MINQIKLEEGYIVRVSEAGERGFFYPSSRKIMIASPCVGSVVSGWLAQEDLVPVSIPSNCVEGVNRYDEKPYMVVWCSKQERM